jgi:N-acetylmuramoyl-L-alanine amidase
VEPVTDEALARGVMPQPRAAPGYLIEMDLTDDLLMFATSGKRLWALNTSTGGRYLYTGTAVADTPVGKFTIFREVDGLVTDNLGQLWRPKLFDAGFAIHGDSYVPPYPVLHGCVRVSNEAIDWIWAQGMAPIGTRVWIYG